MLCTYYTVSDIYNFTFPPFFNKWFFIS